MSRKGVEFSPFVRKKEIENYRKRNPDKDVKLEVHHILGVEDGQDRGVPNQALKSRKNAIALDKETHNKADNYMNDETKNVLAQEFIKMFKKLI